MRVGGVADVVVAVYIIDRVLHHEALFQGRLYGCDVEGQILCDVGVPQFDDGAEIVVL